MTNLNGIMHEVWFVEIVEDNLILKNVNRTKLLFLF